MNILVKKQFSANDSFLGIPNISVQVLRDGACVHKNTSTAMEVTGYDLEGDENYNPVTRCHDCQAWRFLNDIFDSDWMAEDE